MYSYLDPFSRTQGAVLVDSILALTLLVSVLLAYRQRRRNPRAGLAGLGIGVGVLAVSVHLFRAAVNSVVTDRQGHTVLPYEFSSHRPEDINLATAAPWWMWAALATLSAVTAVCLVVTVLRLTAAARRDPLRHLGSASDDQGGGTGPLGRYARLNAHIGTESSRDRAGRFGGPWPKAFSADTKVGMSRVGDSDDLLADLTSAATRKGWTPLASGTVDPVTARSGPWDLTLMRANKTLLVRRAGPAGGIGNSKFGDIRLVHNPGTAQAVIEYASGSDELKFAQFLSWVQQPVDAEPRPDWQSRRLVEAELPSSYARDTATFDDAADWMRAWNAGVDALLGALDNLVAEYPNTTRHNKFQRFGTYTRNVADRIEVQVGRVEGLLGCDGFLLVRDTATEMQLRCDYPDRLPTPAALIGLIRGQLESAPQP